MRSLLLLFFTLSSLFAMGSFPKATSLEGLWHYHIEDEPQAKGYRYHFRGDEATMRLPANWYKAGINHAGVIWFERMIDTATLPNASHHFLEFHGVDYLCDVWVNDSYVGSHKGYFQTFDFDISKYLKRGQNRITVRVNSPLERYPENYSLHKTLLRGIFSHHDTRPGGAWLPEGQDKNSGGIWNSVFIKSYKYYQIKKLKVTPQIRGEDVQIDVSFLINRLFIHPNSHPDRLFLHYMPLTTKETKVTIEVTPANFTGRSYHQTFDLEQFGMQKFSMKLPDAKLWYTYDRGFPHLYHLTVWIGDTSLTQKIGFKTLIQREDKTYVLNGTPLFLKGTNYISSQYMSEMDREALKHDLELMKAAHINTIRVHAHIEPERFYTLCDEMGFLVWQDYNLQWGYIDSPSFTKEAIKQAKEMVDMLYVHPSIFLWSMHNEPPWNSDWMKWKYPDYKPDINKALDDELYQVIKAYDTYHLVKKISSNLEHPWFGWYSGKYTDFANPSKRPVVSEYGAQAIPNLSSLKRFIPQKYLEPKSKKAKKLWEYHDFQFDWSAKNGVKFKKDIETFIKDSQTYQAELIKFATEMLRIQKYTYTTGIFQFMFVEGWPSMNWGVVDYYRKTKPGYDALKKAFAPILVVAKQLEDNRIELYVVNDTLDTINQAKMLVTISSDDGSEGLKFDTAIKADSVTLVATLPPIVQKSELSLRLETDALLAQNHYLFDIKKIVDPYVIVVKQKGNQVELFVKNSTSGVLKDAKLHATLKSGTKKTVYKFSVKSEAHSVSTIATLPLDGKTEIDLSLETDVQLDYRHYTFTGTNVK